MVCVFKNGDGGEFVGAEYVREGLLRRKGEREKRRKGKKEKRRRHEGTKGRNYVSGFSPKAINR